MDTMDELLSKPNCKLNFRQVYRLAHRMVTKYSLDLCKYIQEKVWDNRALEQNTMHWSRDQLLYTVNHTTVVQS